MEGSYGTLNVLAIIAAVIGIIFYIFSWFASSSSIIFGMTKDQLNKTGTSLVLIAIVLWVGAAFNRGNKIISEIL